jgi:uncharacterized membrane protein YqiK
MFEGLGTHASVLALSIAMAVFVLALIGATISRFYRRCGADEALVRTGHGGNRVVLGGGVMVYPILHQLLRVSLRSVKLSVERAGKNALVTADKIKANVATELYIKVEPIADDVLAAARSFGERNLDETAIAELIEGKLTDALRSVSANQTFMSLHAQRKEFAEMIQAALSEELKKNGLTLENVSVTSLSMLQVTELDPTDVFDAEGLRAITESVSTNREKTNQIQKDKENQIHAQNVTARMRQLELEQQQKHAEADQARRVSEYAALQEAETARAVFTQEQTRELAAYEKQSAVERGRIMQEQAIAIAQAEKGRREREAQIISEAATAAAEIQKGKDIRTAEIDRQQALETAEIERMKVIEASTIIKEQTIETARVAKLVAITRTEEEAAHAAAAKALAIAEEERAKQSIITVEATAKAERDKAITTLDAEARAAVQHALAEGEAGKARQLAEARAAEARGEAMAIEAAANAQANRRRAEAQAEADADRIVASARAEAAQQEAVALRALAEAEAARATAMAHARRHEVEAENAVSKELLVRDVALEMIRTLPAVTKELMSPAQKISEIKVLHTGGFGGGSSNGNGSLGAGPLGAISPILSTVMQAGAAYPVLRELMAFGGIKPEAIVSELKGLLSSEAKGSSEAKASPEVTKAAATDTNVSDAEVVFVEDDEPTDDQPRPSTESGEHALLEPLLETSSQEPMAELIPEPEEDTMSAA